MTFNGTTATIKATKPEDYKENTATLRVCDGKGNLVKETKVTYQNGIASCDVIGLKSGETYLFVFTDGKLDLSANYIVKCP